ncbi:hypothetical protein V1460_03960 [Streptomyces sp. SCSIO 30461]|uniref:hypothetical protein n=1 Tax=Streptomyces sp. SCSIO 30461 TaxID=3118085 RepID=UPI0030D58776
MTRDTTWKETKERYPIGSIASGVVEAKFAFGVFLKLDHASNAKGFIDLISYNPPGLEKVPGNELPEIGETVTGTVVELVDRDRQIRLRVGKPFWDEVKRT